MTVPIIKCKNLTTGFVLTIPNEIGYPESLFTKMNDLLSQFDGIHRDGENSFYVHTSETYKYCALLEERKSNDKGKIVIIRYTPKDVENFCQSIKKFSEENAEEMISYVHDIQYLIGTLQHRSIVNFKNKDNINKLRSSLEEINSITSIISAKDTFFRYQTGAFAQAKIPVNVHGKFLKIYKALENLTSTLQKRISINFNSQMIPEIKCYEIFDFIPYLLLENAVKYSPSDSEVDIDLKRYKNEIVAEVSSVGPLLYSDEINRIFERGFRGEQAIDSGIGGRGLGLYHVEKALRDLNIGSIKAEQNTDYPVEMNGTQYVPTTFTLTIECETC